MAGGKKDQDLAVTPQVAATTGPLEEPLAIDLGRRTQPPPGGGAPDAPRANDEGHEPPMPRASDRFSATIRAPGATADEGWLNEDTSLTRATEKSLAVPAAVSPDRATLTILTGTNAGQVVSLDDLEHILGRGTEADVWVEDAAISRLHARFARRPDGRFYVEDLGSTNGTFVTGHRIDARTELKNGDRVHIGPNLLLRFAITDDAEQELQRRLYESSTRDALTRVFNRKYLNERLLAELAHARRHKTHLSLLMLDLDRFKEINDRHGHLAGDMVLRVVASHIARLIRLEDVLARFGGEEFVILTRSTPHRDAVTLAERVRATVARLQISGPGAEKSLAVTVSIGVASLAEIAPEGGANELLAMADGRLYRAKTEGRDRVSSHD